MLQYEKLPTLCYGCSLIDHFAATCTTVRLTSEIKPQYGDWLWYLPPTNLVGTSRPQGRIHYHVTNNLENPSTAFSDKGNHSRPHNFEKEATEDSEHNSLDGASTASVSANVDHNLTDPLEVFLNVETFSKAIEVLIPTPFMMVKPNGETIVEDTSAERITPNSLK
ncbi:hypothetical protein V6N11_022311 [Hibiscus sabdariffa]|uniref:Uncharacterized protein n=1 Tax=Hibiscus sabdariffa TaxID=183260 RepID=A0ABR2TJD6_9ROSI